MNQNIMKNCICGKKFFFFLIVRKVKTQYLLGVYDILRKLLLLFIFFLKIYRSALFFTLNDKYNISNVSAVKT